MRRFYSRLMILLAMIALSIALMFYFICQAQQNVARQLAGQLETASEQEVEELMERLGRLGPAGIPEIVRYLGSTRRVVVLSAQEVLEREFLRWTQQALQYDQQKSAQSHYLLAKSLAENLDQFGPTSRLMANSFAQRILRDLLAIPTQSRTIKRFETIRFCEEIIQKTEGERSVARSPARLNEMYKIAESGEPSRIYPPDPFDEQLIFAANERNRLMLPSRSRPGTLESEFYDPYSSSRAELLYAVYQSRFNVGTGSEKPLFPGDQLSALERLAYDQATDNRESEAAEGDTFRRTQVAERFASQFSPQVDESEKRPMVPEEERLPLLSTYDLDSFRTESYPMTVVENTDLGQTPLEEIPHLPTPDLIRLLQHPNRSIQAIAEKRLRDRDRFRDEHIALAYRLHHPDAEIRKGMIDALVRVPSIQPVPWVLEMLRDGDPEVRLAAVTFIATAKNKTLFQEVLNQAKKDDDPRINGLIDKLERIRKL